MKHPLLKWLNILIFLNPYIIFSQNTFEKGYGTLEDDVGYSVVETSDNGYFISGFTTNYYYGNPEIYTIKTNASGDVEWTHSGNHPNLWNRAYKGIQSFDGGYITCSNIVELPSYNYRCILTKFSSNGILEWEKYYGMNVFSIQKALIQTVDSGFITCGYGFYSYSNYIASIYKLDKSGDVTWSKEYTETGATTTFNDITDSYYNGFTLCGTVGCDGSCNTGWVMKIDTLGNKEWETKISADDGNITFYSITKANDSAYIVCGKKWSGSIFPFRESDIFIVKIDINGNKLWEITYGEDDIEEYAAEVDIADDGNYIITGSNGSQTLLIKVSEQGDILWDQVFDIGTGGTSLCTTSDNGYAICGGSLKFGYGLLDVYLLKTNADGIMTSTNSGNIAVSDIKLYPNPTNSNCIIESKDKIENISVYNLNGKLLQHISPLANYVNLNTLKFESGIYVLKIKTANIVEVRRLVVNH